MVDLSSSFFVNVYQRVSPPSSEWMLSPKQRSFPLVVKDMIQAQVSAGALFSLLPSLETEMPGAVPATWAHGAEQSFEIARKKDVKQCHKFTTHPGNGGKFTTNRKMGKFFLVEFPGCPSKGKTPHHDGGRYPKNGMRSKEYRLI